MSDCQTIKQFNQAYDPRYTELSLKISEYDVQMDSGVWDTLRALPLSTKYIDSTAKQNTLYSFWTRPSISWKLECDMQYSRSSIIRSALNEKNKPSLHEGAVMACQIISFLIGLCLPCCSISLLVKGRAKKN